MIGCNSNLNILYSTVVSTLILMHLYKRMVIYIALICIVLLTLYIYKALFLGSVSCTMRYCTLYCSPVVDVSYVVNGEIKRPGRNTTSCCIKS